MSNVCNCGNLECCICSVPKPKRKRYWKTNKYRRQKRKMIASVLKKVKKRGEWK